MGKRWVSLHEEERQFRREVFAHLRDLWVQDGEGRAYKDLAEKLGVTGQQVSQWATGTGSTTPPPMEKILMVCRNLGLKVLIGPRDCRVVKDNK